MVDHLEPCNCDQALELVAVLSKLLDAIDNPGFMDSFERQYYCGELDELLAEAYAAVDRERIRE